MLFKVCLFSLFVLSYANDDRNEELNINSISNSIDINGLNTESDNNWGYVETGCDGSHSCRKLRVRKDIKSLTPKELQDLIYVFNQLKNNGYIQNISSLHATKIFNEVHGKAQFFPWHRMFLLRVEDEMRKIIPDITLPYWDAAVDCRNPWKSIVFTPEYFGGNGLPENGYCVRDGFVKNWTYSDPIGYCLRRQFKEPPATWHCPEWVTSVIQSAKNFEYFSKTISVSIHYLVHRMIGGNAGDISFNWSPHDPLLFLHHANMDRIWAKWQHSDPRKSCEYNGVGFDVQLNQAFKARINDQMSLYTESRISETMKLGFGKMCYTYDQFLAENMDTNKSLAQTRLESSLKHEDLVRYFPRFADNTATFFDSDLPHVLNPASDVENPLPFFEPLDRSFKGDSDFEWVLWEDTKFVEVLRDNKYVSPYNDEKRIVTRLY